MALSDGYDFSEVKGQRLAQRAVEVAVIFVVDIFRFSTLRFRFLTQHL